MFASYFLGTYTFWGFTLSAFSMWVTITAVQMPVLQLREASEVPLMMRLFPIKH